MSIEGPTELTGTCDICGSTEQFDVTEYCGDPVAWGVDDSTIKEKGWKEVEGELFCPDCLESRKED